MPVGTPTTYPTQFPDDNIRNIRFFRQNWYPDWEFDASEDLQSDLVGTAEWNANNPEVPVLADASNNPVNPTSLITSPQIRPYYYDPDCPPIGTSGSEDGTPYSSRGSWLSFDTLVFDYAVDTSPIQITCAGSAKPYHMVPAAGFVVGVTYIWYPSAGGVPTTYKPENECIDIRIQEDPSRIIKLPMNTEALPPPTTLYAQRKRFSFYLYTNAYDVVEVTQRTWSAGGPTAQRAAGLHVTIFWKEARPPFGEDVPLDPIDPTT